MADYAYGWPEQEVQSYGHGVFAAGAYFGPPSLVAPQAYAYKPPFVPTSEQLDAYARAPDAYVSGLAIEGDGYTSIVPEGWEGYFPTTQIMPDQACPEPQRPGTRSKKRNKVDGKEEVAKRIQGHLKSSARGVGGLRKSMNKYDSDKDGRLSSAELKRLLQKDLKIALSGTDIDTFFSALDEDRQGTLSIDEILNFLEGRGTPTLQSITPPIGAPQEEEDREEPERSSSRAQGERDEEDGDGDGSEDGKKPPSRNADGSMAQRGSSKTASLALGNGNNTLMFLPLGGTNLITLASPTPRGSRKARKEPLQKSQMKGKDEEASPPPAGEATDALGKTMVLESRYWLRGGGTRGSPQPAPATARAVRKGGSPKASKRPHTVGSESGTTKVVPKKVMAGKLVFQPQVGLPGESPPMGYLMR
mmetsp:Transcript_53985/g.96680  ORF Transcript_53985/g.96680 Transcript_53985/m.96680 type:complete len:418 (-) Transcript_53985:54-1307(-)